MYLSQQDVLTGAFALAIIILALVVIEWMVKKDWASKLIGRKLLHITAICTCAYAIHSFENTTLLAGIFVGFFFILLAVINKGWMQVNANKTFGIALFPLAFALLLLIPILPKSIIVFAALTLGICDAIAGLAGEYFGKQKIIFLFEQKSWVGCVAFFISCFLLAIVYFQQYTFNGFLLCSVVAVVPAITELFSYKGSDNLSVPIITAVWAYLILPLPNHELHTFVLYTLLFLVLCFVAVYKKWLDVSGATAALWIALFLFITGGLKAFIAPGIFLLSGSLLSKLNKNDKEKNGRNAIQVFCNGLVGIGCMIVFTLTQQNIFLIAAIISFCISMSDSSSSELGVYFKGGTYDILSFKKMPVGVSGGISLPGTVAGLAGALALSCITGYSYHFSIPVILWITMAGFTGMLMDSILGSWLQIKYKNAAGLLSDDAFAGSKKVHGFSWCNNNAVNIISNMAITALFFYILKQIS